MTELPVAKTITPQSWMTNKPATKVMQALGQGNALFVGGCVRNMLLGKPVTDIDIATRHHPDQTIALLQKAGIKAIPTGIAHGTITAAIDKQPIEITTLRKDVATDGRRATIAFSDSWTEDAQRRDFTLNTLLADSNGHIYDPLQTALKDLEREAILFVGNPETRIQEDILRILRFFRFHALYGAGEPDQSALKACQKHAYLIDELSKERITQEYLKILSCDKAPETLALMHAHNVMPELTQIQNLHLTKLSLEARLSLAPETARDKYLTLSNKQKKTITAINNVLKESEQNLQKALYHHGRDPVRQAHYIQTGTTNDTIETWPIPTFPIKAKDLMQKDFQEGPELGAELKRLEQEWIENGFSL